jgi:hypothetical protein
MKNIIDFLFSKRMSVILQIIMLLGISHIVFIKKELVIKDVISTIFYAFIYLVEEIKTRTGYYEK